MDTIRIEKNTLLKKLKENLEQHRLDYKEMVKDYFTLIKKIQRTNGKLIRSGNLANMVNLQGYPTRPTSYESEYIRAISMLEYSVDDVIELEAHQFQQLVMDEWGWKQSFTAVSSSYKSLVK